MKRIRKLALSDAKSGLKEIICPQGDVTTIQMINSKIIIYII